jgi:hypothetical protein
MTTNKELKKEMDDLKETLGSAFLKLDSFMFLGKEIHKKLKSIDVKVKLLEKEIELKK